MKYPAHEALRKQLRRFPRKWNGTLFDAKGEGKVDDMVTVMYKNLLAEFDELKRQVK